jgi:hypothetical protein
MKLQEALEIIKHTHADLSEKCIAAEKAGELEGRAWARHSDFDCSRDSRLLDIYAPDPDAVLTDQGVYIEGWLHGVLKFVDEDLKLKESERRSGYHQFRWCEIEQTSDAALVTESAAPICPTCSQPSPGTDWCGSCTPDGWHS